MNIFTERITERLVAKPWILYSLLFLICVAVSIQRIYLDGNVGDRSFWGGNYTHFNNFIIFKTSFLHLIENKNLYLSYAEEYADLYKYSPTFAVFMGPLYYLPDGIGLIIWNSLNVLVFFYAILSIRAISKEKLIWLIPFLIFETILSSQNSQSNCLLAGLTIIAFNQFERGRNSMASLFILLGALIKIYSVIAVLLFFLYPQKRKTLVSFMAWFAILFLLPLLFIDFSSLIGQYKNWYAMLITDEDQSIGMSIFAFTEIILPPVHSKFYTLMAGLAILFAPLLNYRKYNSFTFRLGYLSLLIIWMVVFNHKAESPTYVIAMAGIGIWYLSGPGSRINLSLVLLSFLFTSLWFTDLIPAFLRKNLFEPKYVKTFFPILVLGKIFLDLTIISSHGRKLEDNPDSA